MSIIEINQFESKNYEGFACFDLDHTIIKPKSGKIFPKDRDDWEFMDNVESVLKTFHNNNWLVVVFTNQSGLKTSKKITVEDFEYKLINIANSLEINIKFIASLDKDYFRKPMLGMWEMIQNEFSYINEHSISKFYCGDAFNPHDKLKASDLRFAWHAKIDFIYPDKLFQKDFTIYKVRLAIQMSKNDFIAVIKYYDELISTYFSSEDMNNVAQITEFKNKYQYIFIIAPPSSGKSTFCKKYLSEYIRLSKDDYKTKAKYIKAILDNKDQKIVFDNTNYTDKSRKEIIDILVSFGINIENIGFIIRDVSKPLSMYLNKYRCMTNKSKALPDVAIHSYFKNVSYPQNNYIKLPSMITSLEHKNLLF